MSRMMLYLWEDTDADNPELKLGDHWVGGDCTLEEAVEDTKKYIRRSLHRQKYKYDYGRVIIHAIWDVSEYAKKYNKFYQHSQVDSHIRHVVGNRIQADFHGTDPEMAINRILQELGRVGQPLRDANLSFAQCYALENTLDAFRSNKKTILAELCARFGKTVYAGAVAKELGDVRLVVVASYVLSVFTSFENDWRGFSQLCEFEHVDTSDPNYKKQISQHLKNNKKVVVYVSMCSGENRDKRIEYLFKRREKKMLIIDEADYGVHRENQITPLLNARKPNDRVLIMTGTNGDRAASSWDIDHYIGVTYQELIVNKNAKTPYDSSRLKYFDYSLVRDKLTVDCQFYQLDLKDVVKQTESSWYDGEEFKDDLLPSWSKFAANPMRAKGFWTRMLEAMLLGRHNTDSVNIDHQALASSRKVSMMFLPGNITNENLRHAVTMASEVLTNFIVVGLSGYNKVSNRNVEQVAKDAIDLANYENKNVLLISANIGQRSFSLEHITDLFLAYDKGEAGATTQKVSRVLTSEKFVRKKPKTGRVWNMSFNPNRDDKFDCMVLETAKNIKKSHGMDSIIDALRLVYQTIDIFECTHDGSVRVDFDTYLQSLYSRKSLSRVIGKLANLTVLSVDDIKNLASGNTEYFTMKTKKVAKSGKTKDTVPVTRNKKQKTITDVDIEKARKAIVTIAENMDVIVYGTNSKTITEALDKIAKSKKLQDSVIETMGVDYRVIKFLIDKQAINVDFIEMLHGNPS